MWTKTELAGLPNVCRYEFAQSINNSFQTLAWPHQQLLSLNPLLGKPTGGIRTICKTPMLYRIPMISRKSVPQWEAQNVRKYDTAYKGSSCLTAALKRNVIREVAGILNKPCTAVFNDFHKLFDSIDIPVLIDEAIATDYPLCDLSLALQNHLAPRALQAGGFTSKAVQVYKSILAGCRQSVAMTRALLLRLMRRLATEHSSCPPAVHVDDTCMQKYGNDIPQVTNAIAPCILQFAKGVKKLGLTLSPKGVIVSSAAKVSAALCKEFQENGIIFKAATHARDVGVSYTANARTSVLLDSRILKNVSKFVKLKQLSAISRNTRKLFSGAGFSSSTWSHPSCGVSRIQLKKIEAGALAATGIPQHGRCTTLALNISYGVLGTPTARIIRETITEWCKVVHGFFRFPPSLP